MLHVALIKDATGDYFLIAENVDTFRDLLNALEDIGAEVIENQTEDWADDVDSIQEDCFSIAELLESTTFVSHDDPRLWEDDYADIGLQSYSVAERNGSLC